MTATGYTVFIGSSSGELKRRMPRRWVWLVIGIALLAGAVTAPWLYSRFGPQPAFAGRTWNLVNYKDPAGRERAVMARSTASILFERGRASGTGGCNDFSCSYEVDGQHLEFGEIEATARACFGPVMREEAAFFDGLRQTTSYKLDGSTLTLLNQQGEAVLVLRAEEAQE